jgi:alpha-ketoglutarate-dependent taurine dioxygenase
MGEFKSVQRKTVRLSEESLVRTGFLDPAERFPLVVEPAAVSVDLLAWAAGHRELVEQQLVEHAGILFRGFGLAGPAQFQQLARVLFSELLDYKERAAPRVQISPGVYTSTEFPPDQWIPLHHEMSYSHNWPTKILFFCDQPPEQGGRTPIASARKVTARIDPGIRQRFLDKKVMYVRNYGEGVDLSWQEAFQTDDRAVVEEYCRKGGMQADWRDGDRLRTRGVRQVMVQHPRTGETVWFNHAHMFHSSNLQPEVREALLAQFKEDELPRNSFYGDGSPIESSVLDEIRQTYLDASLAFPWQQGDVLILDNFLAAHGREPFSGHRRILVAMAELHTNQDLVG